MFSAFAAVDKQPLAHTYGLCERVGPEWFAEPLNAVSNIGFLIVAFLIYRDYKAHPDLKGQWIWDVRILTFLIALIGVCSITFHTNPSRLTELMDIIPIVTFIVLFFLSIIVRIGKTNWFQTLICFMAFLGTTHMLVTQFPNAMNDSIGYLSSMAALVMIAVHLHIARRPSSHQFLLAALVGVISLFFRAIDNDICAEWPFGTHFLWHTLNATLLYILMKQVIRNVNREARIERLKRAGLS
jgi:hypothetical protein